MIGASFISIRLLLLRDEPLDFCGEESSVILTKNILLADFCNEKILCHTNTTVETKVLAIFSEPKKKFLLLTQATLELFVDHPSEGVST